ncbi:MAG: hypothetical protein GTO71_02480 [Woeseiaceae bacterium]|nr:hypothetical protein [Woeseiaceae bacterium]NIP19977.1 hypothetical protein [Woeseiaceae bacterium]NIS88773.1 hypothetical protein [Woeseiaceae bacterium]
MNTKHITVALVLLLPGIAATQDSGNYQCTHGDLVRRVEIFTDPGVSVPCEVHYFKDTEAPGESQVLWKAQAEEGYCEAQAAEFIAKLEGWGWSCGAGDAPATEPAAESEEAPEPEVQDDTDVLSPGEPEN